MSARLLIALVLVAGLVLGGALVLLGVGSEEVRGDPIAGDGRGAGPVMAVDGDGDRPADRLVDLAGAAGPLAAEPAEAAPMGLAATGRVTGRVVDERGVAVAGAPVDLIAEDDPWGDGDFVRNVPPDVVDRTRSDADGRFSLAARAGVGHGLLAGGERYARTLLEWVAAGDDLTVTLRDGRAVVGTVVSRDTGAPVGGAWVQAASSDDRVSLRADDGGDFRVGPVPTGTVFLGGWAPGHDVATLDAVSPDWGPVTLELPPGRDLDALVVDAESGLPVAGAAVRLVMTRMSRPAFAPDPLAGRSDVYEIGAVSDEEGRLTFVAAPSRGFRIEAEADGYLQTVRRRWERRSVNDGEVLRITMAPIRGLPGRVLFDGAPMAGAAVRLDGGGGLDAATITDAEGAFELPLQDWDGENKVAVEARVAGGGGAPELFARHVMRRGEEQVELQLVAPLEVTALVLDGGLPVVGAQVAAISDEAPTTLVPTDDDGLARLVHLVSGGDVKQVALTARHGSQVSLGVTIDLREERPSEPVVIDLDVGARVGGEVVDPAGMPIPGATVSLEGGRFQRTDDQGRFDLFPIPPGSEPLTLNVWATGFRHAECAVMPGSLDVSVVLEPLVHWSVSLLDGASGLPLSGGGGRLQTQEWDEERGAGWADGPQRVVARPGVPGAYAVELPRAGRYRLALGAPDRLPVFSEPVDFDGRYPPPPLDVVLFPSAVLEMIVTDDAGRGLPGLGVSVVEIPEGMHDLPDKLLEGGRFRGTLRHRATDGDGVVRIDLGEGGLVRAALGRGRWLTDRPLLVTPGPPSRHRARLGPSGDLLVTVVDEAGEVLPGAGVSVRSVGDPRPFDMRRKLRTPVDGGPALAEALLQGEYEVKAGRRGYGEGLQTVFVAGGGVSRVTLTLPPRNAGGVGASAGAGKKDR